MTKTAMLQTLKAEFDMAYTEWQISENLLDDMEMDSDESRECVERCAIREFQECETISRIAEKLFNVSFIDFID